MSPAYERARVAYDLNRFSDAVRELLQALAEDPGDAAPHVLLGQCRCAEGDLDAAFAAIKAGLALEPDLAHGHFALAWVHKAQGDWDHARAAVLEAVRLAPRSPDYWRAWPRSSVASVGIPCHWKPASGGWRWFPSTSIAWCCAREPADWRGSRPRLRKSHARQ